MLTRKWAWKCFSPVVTSRVNMDHIYKKVHTQTHTHTWLLNFTWAVLYIKWRVTWKKYCLILFCSANLKCFGHSNFFIQNSRIQHLLGERPNLLFAGSNVNLSITTDGLVITVMESGEVLRVPNSFNYHFISLTFSDHLAHIAYQCSQNMKTKMFTFLNHLALLIYAAFLILIHYHVFSYLIM